MANPFLQAGANASTPGRPDPRFALYERQGVLDKTGVGAEMNKQLDYQIGGEAAKAAGKVATDIYTGYHIAQLEKDIQNEAINPFLNGIDPEFQAQNNRDIAETQGQLSGLRGQKEGIFKTMFESDINPIPELQANESSTIKESQKLQSALKQGRMTQAEFEIRLRKVTREAINRNPGLQDQLIRHAQLVESMSGIRYIADPKAQLDKAESKQEAERVKLFISQAKSVGIYIDPAQVNDPNYQTLMGTQIQQAHQDMFNSKEVARMNKDGEIADTLTSAQRERLVPSVIRGRIHDFVNEAAGLAGEALSNNTAAKTDLLTNLKVKRETLINALNDDLAKQGIKPNLRNEHVNFYSGSIDRIVKAIEEDVSGEKMSKILDNQRNAMLSTQKINVLKHHDVAALELVSKLPTNSAFTSFLLNNQEVGEGIQRSFSNVLKGYLNEDSLKTLYERNIVPGKSDAAFLTGMAFQTGNSDAASQIIKTAKQLTVDFADKNFGSDVEKKVSSQWDIIREIGKLKNVDNIKLDAEAMSSFTTMGRDFLDYAGTRFSREVSKLEEDPMVDIITKFGKDGRMTIEAIDPNRTVSPSKIAELNQKYANAFNDAIQSFAVINNDNWAGSSTEILNRYADKWQIKDPGNPLLEIAKQKKLTGSRGQNPNNPLNLKVPGENKFQNFQDKSEGLRASYSQLLKYHDGSSANTDRPLQTPLEMLRLWNNQAESGSATDRQYAQNVARYSGLDLSQTIDKGDVDSWTDLLYGMAIAEGSKGVTRKEIRQAIKGA